MKGKKKTAQTVAVQTAVSIFLLSAVIVYAAIRIAVAVAVGGMETGEAFLLALREAGPALLVVIAGWLASCLFLQRRVSEPVHKVAGKLNTFFTDAISGGAPLDAEGKGEVGELIRAYGTLSDDLKSYTKNITELKIRRAREEAFKEAGRLFQSGLVPAKSRFGGLDYGLCALVCSAEETGGDFYDCFPLGDDRVCMIVGDVAGKGVDAALCMGAVRTMLHDRLCAGCSLRDALGKLNEELFHGKRICMVTLFAGIFTPESGELRFINAGHPLPVVAGETAEFLTARTGSALGLFENAGLEEEKCFLEAGQSLVVYTDGLFTESNPKREKFGKERLLRTAAELAPGAANAEQIADGLKRAADSFREGEKLLDDYAILVLYYPNGLQKQLKPELAQLGEVRETLLRWLGDDPRKKRIYLACEEVFTNIVRHSGANNVHLDCENEGNSIVLRFMDDGAPFNPLAIMPQERNFYDYEQGGMGIAIIRQLSGEIFYRTKGEHNVLTIRFPRR